MAGFPPSGERSEAAGTFRVLQMVGRVHDQVAVVQLILVRGGVETLDLHSGS